MMKRSPFAMSELAKRLVAGVGANAMAQATTIGIQLASLPLFLEYWDTAKYGVWLMISAVPSYFSMADVGMVTAAGNVMTMALGRGDTAAANGVFQSALVFTLATCVSLALISIPAVLWLPFPATFASDERIALAALILAVLLTLFGGIAEAIFRATGRYALVTTLSNFIRLGEWCGWITGLILFRTFAAVALGGLAVRFLGLIVLISLSTRGKHGLAWRFHCATWTHVRAMITPALSFMAFPMSNALSFQGMTLLTGSLFGPATVAVFNTYRTLARVAVQATSIFSNAMWPEFSRHFGKGGAQAVASMYRQGAALGVLSAVALSLTLFLSGPLLLKFWTHGVIAFQTPLMALMLAYAAVSGGWHVPRVLLMSTNEHDKLAVWSLCIAAVSLALAAFLSRLWRIEGVVFSMLAGEVVIAVICAYHVERLLGTRTLRVHNDVA